MKTKTYILFFILFFLFCSFVNSKEIVVSNPPELSKAVKKAIPGDIILIESGFYIKGFSASKVMGLKNKPITIKAKNKNEPPVFSGKGECIKLNSCRYIEISDLKIFGFSGNSINIDDSGNYDFPSSHIVLKNLSILDTGKNRNIDGIKLSGVDNFIISNCHIEGYGGSGIDLVGCHNGIIEKTLIKGKPDFRNRNGIQVKGGSSDIIIQNCTLINTGERSINIGGNTGKNFFRPIDADYEAKNIIVAGNKFIGSKAHIAWVTCFDTYVHNNIFYLPKKFLARILQETKDKRFVKSSKSLFEKNIIITDQMLKKHINIGPLTSPETFFFVNNAWYSFNSKQQPDLPTREINGVYNIYPDLKDFGTKDMKVLSKDPKLNGIGPKFYKSFVPVSLFGEIKIPEIKKTSFKESSLINIYVIALLASVFTIAFILLVSIKSIKKDR